jgi:SAM-dependent methyltransferase
MQPLLSPFLQRQRFHAIHPYLFGDILDLGCGHAEVTQLLEEAQSYIGIEQDVNLISWLEENFPSRKFYQRDLDCEDLDIPGRFDTILMVALIEHLRNPERLLSQLPGYLKDEGKLVITTPTPFGDRIHRIGARLGFFSMIAVRDHETIYTKTKLRSLLEKNGFALIHHRSFLIGGNQLFVYSLI